MNDLTPGQKRGYKAWRAEMRRQQAIKTKPGARQTADGRLSKAKDARPYEPPPPVPAVKNRQEKLGLSERDARSKFGGTGHGLAFLKGFISHEGFLIAERYGRLRHAFQGVTHHGPKEPRSAAIPYDREFTVTPEQSSPDGEAHTSNTDKVETPEEREKRVRRDWDRVMQALSFSASVPHVLNDVIVRGQALSEDADWQRQAFIQGLQALAEHWGRDPQEIVPSRKSKDW